MPAPRPVPTDITVGCYYFPGHFNAARWAPMKSYGHPRPLLGYYRDGAPGVADWHIKWAVEHGISFFAFDWYYDYHTGRVSEHNTALDEGFLKAQYRDLMRFAIFWCNEEGAAEAPYTREQMLLLGKVLGERYFSQSNYLRIDGRPVLFVSEPGRLWQSFGEGFRDLLPEIVRAAGLPEGTELFLVGKQSDNLDRLARMGFSACTAYNYAGNRTPNDGSPLRATYDDMVEVYEQMWRQVTDARALPYIVPLSPGWDSRPWYGPHAFVRTHPTAAKFREMCERAKRYVDPKLNMVIAECWNEFGEGSFVEPTEEFGFGALDALRETFCRPGDWPPNAAPSAEEKATWTYDAIPDDPLHLAPSAQISDLLPWGDMEDNLGWIGFDHAPAKFSTEKPHSGGRSLAIAADTGVKSTAHVGLAFGREYEVTAWVRCSPGANVQMIAALFGRDGRWTRTYHDLGCSESTGWTRIAARIPGLDPAIGAIDVEFVATGGACYADDVSVSVVGALPTPTVFADTCASADGWVTYDGGPASIAEGALHIPSGAGVKTRSTLPAGPNTTYAISAQIRCDEMATLEVRAAEFDGAGAWLRTYAPIASSSVSWQDWVEVTFTLAFPADTQARLADLEFVALGGEGFVRNVRVVQGGRLDRR
ncbi:MAG: hypothetical protein FJX75_24880 [Armatimonadetes bacterium]|nr:hypothetical protein [Armatimonadota bacterium]